MTLGEIRRAGYKFIALDVDHKLIATSGGLYVTYTKDSRGEDITVLTTEEIKEEE